MRVCVFAGVGVGVYVCIYMYISINSQFELGDYVYGSIYLNFW